MAKSRQTKRGRKIMHCILDVQYLDKDSVEYKENISCLNDMIGKSDTDKLVRLYSELLSKQVEYQEFIDKLEDQ